MNFANVKSITIPEGNVTKIQIDTNSVPTSIDTDGSILNGCGYQDGVRVGSTGELAEHTYCSATGFMPVVGGETIRFKGGNWNDPTAGASNCICYCNGSFDALGSFTTQPIYYGICTSSNSIVTTEGEYYITTVPDNQNISYVRISTHTDGTMVNGISTHGKRMVVLTESGKKTLWELITYTNQVPLSIGTDKKIYNGGLGYKNGYRIRSGGAEGALSCSAHTGFIPVKAGDVIRIGGLNFGSAHSHGSAMNVANSSFTNIGQFSMQSGEYGIFTESAYRAYSKSSVVQEKTGVWKWVVPPAASGVAYIRVSCNMYDTSKAADGSKLIVTINEEIT